MSKKVSATVTNDAGKDVRLYGEIATGDDTVTVWIASGPVLGGYRLSRFAGGALTSGSLRALFGAPVARHHSYLPESFGDTHDD